MRNADALQPGTTVGGKYRIDHLLGQGGMGVVYAATHTQLDQRVALKFLLGAAARNPELVERFAREARAAVRVHSEHVARVLDVGELDPGTPYIVMEYLEGQSLDALLDDGKRLPITQAIDYVLQTCEALAEVHARGIVHRDIKPGNLFLAQRPGRSIIKVLDFGISKVPMTTHDIGLTSATAMMGSPGYMSPEQVMGASTVDVRSDIWALGAVLYQMLGGQPPFIANTLPTLIAAVLHRPHVPLKTLAPAVPAGLEAAIDWCLEKEVNRRPASVAELAFALVPFGPTGSAEVATRIAHVLGVAPPVSDPRIPLSSPEVLASTLHDVSKPASSVASTTTRTTRTTRTTALAIVVVAFSVFAIVAAAIALRTRTSSSSSSSSSPSAAPSTTVVVINATIASDVVPVTIAPSTTPSASVSATTQTRPAARPRPSVTSTASVAPVCEVVAYLDENGEKHFKQVCP